MHKKNIAKKFTRYQTFFKSEELFDISLRELIRVLFLFVHELNRVQIHLLEPLNIYDISPTNDSVPVRMREDVAGGQQMHPVER